MIAPGPFPRPTGPAPGVVARYVVLGAAVGVPVGLVWAVGAPRVVVRSLSEPDFLSAYPQGFAAADLLLGALLALAGIALGVSACVRLGRTGFARGWVHLLGLLAATAVCAAVARILGWWLAGRSGRALDDGTYELPVDVGAGGVLLSGAFTALLVVVIFAAFARDPVTPEVAPSGPSSP